MAAIASIPLLSASADPWPDIVRTTLTAWEADRIEVRDAVFLVPFAQHLALARKAWALCGRWMPRIETTRTLAASLGPPEPAAPFQIRFDAALDRLAARRLLRAQAWATALWRGDSRGFDQAVHALVTVAHALARAGASVAPAERAEHWDRGRALLGASSGPGGTERLLARVALEWAASAPTPPTDALFALRPSAWVAVQAGGVDPLVHALFEAMPTALSCRVIDTDAAPDAPFAGATRAARIEVAVCADFEDEAQRTAAEVLAALERGARPVALIAQDRLLMRRVRALLARRHVALQDETGWKLSTTRAGAVVAALLRAARHDATSDDWLDWLKSIAPDWPRLAEPQHATQALEAAMRRHAWTHPAMIVPDRLDPAAVRLWSAAVATVERLSAPRRRGLRTWLQALAAALEACGAMSFLQADDAGRQLLAALHLDDGAGLQTLDDDEPMNLDDFSAWVDGVLEEGSFRPEAPAEAAVVITPLERAMLRPFGSVVFPAADEKRLGAAPAPLPLLGEAAGGALGVPTAALQRQAELLAFAQLLRMPSLVLLRRRDDAGEAVGPSPVLERLELARFRAGLGALPTAADPSATRRIVAIPVDRPLPVAAALLPAQLSASACEALRACPYRFFALYLLRLREAEELDDEVEKRDYGTWLHDVLYRFHLERTAPAAAAVELARLEAIAAVVRDELHLDEAAFLPFAATFTRVAPRYVEWLHERDARGVRWLDGERELTAAPLSWRGIGMYGRLDRVDSVPGDDGPVTQLIDYKTGSAEALRLLVRQQPQEDTQLAFYAALMAGQSDAAGPIAAAYLPLDERDRIKPIEHDKVEAAAERLVAELGDELDRLRAHAPLPALGEGRACDFCAARGLCRRDHWPAAPAPVALEAAVPR